MKINTFTVIMLALAILVGSCDAPSDNALYREWRLQKYNCIATSSYGLTQVNEESEYILQLDNAGVFSCTTDCNTVSGSFEKSKTALKFSDISFTELACDNMIVERSVASILPSIKSYEITDDSILVLKDDKGHILMELTK
ncbi:META domain-containing protein [uncultured Parabacteroides sp.]|uniref:META domain-containing protein n=1 Tax=uncultured Parabacteroides sp. TaxID=512312 RepID=UPI00261B1518|nr:META domain-containing protein [uncultured Parabacteroides sp.]